jgi:mono/diheme cytochrome c family protein
MATFPRIRVSAFLVAAMVATVTWLTGAAVLAQRNPEAAKMTNPVAATTESIAAGKALYTRNCAACHGVNAEGGTGNDIAPPSPDLTDAEWAHGDSDGEIFFVLKNGVPPDLNMPAWGDRIKDPDLWNILNYVRSLKKK